MAAQVAIRRQTDDRLLVEDSRQTGYKQDLQSSCVLPRNSLDLPGPSGVQTAPRVADSNRVTRCLWILGSLFPDVSKIFLTSLLEARDFDLLSTLEVLIGMARQGNIVPVSLHSVITEAAYTQPWNDYAAALALMSLSS